MTNFIRRVFARIDRLIGVSISRTFVYRAPTSDDVAATTAIDREVSWEVLSPEQVGEILDIGQYSNDEWADRVERGDRCWVATVNGKLAHYIWVQTVGAHRLTSAGVSVPIASGEFWLYNARTMEDARGRGIYVAALRKLSSDLLAEGYVTGFIYVAERNVVSQRGILRAGFIPIGVMRALRVGRYYFHLSHAIEGK